MVLGELTCVCITLPVSSRSATSLPKVAGPKQKDLSCNTNFVDASFFILRRALPELLVCGL